MPIEWEFLSRKTVGSGAVFLDEKQRILIVKPNYKEGWNLPGGRVENDESPTEACAKEVFEEIGLKKSIQQLACVQYMKKAAMNHDHIRLAFFGGILSESEIRSIKLQQEELTEFKFAALSEMKGYVDQHLLSLIESAIAAQRENKVIYIES